MRRRTHTRAVLIMVALLPTATVLGNGGPFVIKYPNGDPAAKGILARFDEDLKPQRETRLRVIEEQLDIRFEMSEFLPSGIQSSDGDTHLQPVAFVSASYRIENPTDEEIEVDFGFPILRGIYTHPFSMMPMPEASARLGNETLHVSIISNSAIYSMIRQRARDVIEKHIADDPKLAEQVARCRVVCYVRDHARRGADSATGEDKHLKRAMADDPMLASLVNATPEQLRADRDTAREALAAYLTDTLKWNQGDTTLMVEFASLDFGAIRVHPRDRNWVAMHIDGIDINSNLGALSAIGEQKATQFFAHLAGRFEPEVTATYESIFESWGGDVRERSVDIKSGKLRPREITVANDNNSPVPDPTVYARVDYFDENAPINEEEKASCRAVLKNLKVIFTFAPMNLLHYQAKFKPNSTEILTVEYRQYAFKDTAEPESYQLAYVVHPASLWDSFGPIKLSVSVPEDTIVRGSVPLELTGSKQVTPSSQNRSGNAENEITVSVYEATIEEKSGELFLAVEAASWKKAIESVGKTAMLQQAGT